MIPHGAMRITGKGDAYMNGPMNRKKVVAGKASEDSMKTHGEARNDGPVGDASGHQGRKEAQTGGPRRASQTPFNRPRPTAGSASGSMNTHGAGTGGRPQQTRPSMSSGARPSGGMSSSGGMGGSGGTGGGGGGGNRAGGRGFSPLLLIILAVVLLGGGGGLSGILGGLLGGGNTTTPTGTGTNVTYNDTATTGGNTTSTTSTTTTTTTATDTGIVDTYGSTGTGLGALGGLSGLSDLFGGATGGTGSYSSESSFSGYSSDLLQQLLGGGWYSSQTGAGSTGTPVASSGYSGGGGKLNRNVASGSRAKYTKIKGSGRDVFTLMVYMCGADLESRSAMGTKDLQEMLYAEYGDNVRVIVFTGGAKQWQNKYISSSVNQIWQVKGGQLKCLNENAGTTAMTNPSTLSSFIRFCASNFSANRYGLILWDHGCGSVSGYGYDEKNARSGSMSLAGLNSALTDGGVKFDFIGYDACLMATLENALMCTKHADYLIASEETEPGIGWYYTNWLTALGKDTSLSTLDIGQRICDDFVSQCAKQCRGQQTTLSVVDLAELEHTVPGKFASFSQSISTMVANKEYKAVSNARSGAREFAQSNRIDQVDLTDLCNRMDTTQSKALSAVLTEAVKYNRTSNISNAYGLSVYFPYQKFSNVDKAVNTYNAIGMDSAYAKAISDFASVGAAGQGITGGTGSALNSLFGLTSGGYGSPASSSYSGGQASEDMISGLLSQFLGGGYSGISGLGSDSVSFLTGRSVPDETMVQILTENRLDIAQLVFEQNDSGWTLSLSPEQWAQVSGVDQNLFYDNGEGYVDMGLDNLFSFDADGRLVADMDATWLAINGQPAPYYHETTDYFSEDVWRVTGRVPALLNGERVDLLIAFDAEHEYGYISGARPVYDAEETETVAKSLLPLNDGDEIRLLADLYDYDQNYTASYEFGSPITVDGEPVVANVYLPDASRCKVTYRITDIYNQAYWTPVIGG